MLALFVTCRQCIGYHTIAFNNVQLTLDLRDIWLLLVSTCCILKIAINTSTECDL